MNKENLGDIVDISLQQTIGGRINQRISEEIFHSIISREVSNNIKVETSNKNEPTEKIKGQDVYKVRFHRGGLKDSMETYFEPKIGMTLYPIV